MTTPVYICTGFLDSGKTTFIKDTLMKQEWIEEGPTLLLQCEEGEEEYSEKYLDENGLFLFNIEEREKLNKTFFENCEKIYHPVQVIIEYNGTWDLQEILDEDFPRNWEIQGVYSTVSGETLDMYLKNMFIDDVDFGTWYVDAYEHPERYEHKKITFLAQLFRPKGMPANMLIPGRQIMTCCADDIRFYGYPCNLGRAAQITQRSWKKVTVKFEYEAYRPMVPKQPVLYMLEMESAEKPEEEVVYLG